MRVTKLVLENFRNHASSTLQIGAHSFVVIRGRNFAGKSSVGQGLSLCLTPTTTGLNPQGRNFAAKIKRGQDKAVITAEIDWGGCLVSRQVALSAGIAGRTERTVCLNDPNWDPAPFNKQLQSSRAALTVAINTDAFLGMNEAAQKNLLAALALPARYDFDREIVNQVTAVSELWEEKINFGLDPLTVINAAYKKLYDERQIVNRQVRDFVIPEELPYPAREDPPDDSHETADSGSARLEEKRKEALGLHQGLIYRRNQARDQAASQENKIRAKIEKLEKALADDRRRQEELSQDVLALDRLEAIGQTFGAARLKEDERSAARVRLGAEEQQAQVVLAGHVRAEARIAELGQECPTCGQAIDQKRLKDMADKLFRETWKATQEVSRLQKTIAALDLLAKHDAATNELGSIEARIADQTKQLEKARASLQPVDLEPYDKAIAESDAEIGRLAAELRPMIAAEERRKEIAIKQNQLAALERKAAQLDRLVKYFDKDGIKAKLIQEYIGGFEEKINETMRAWGYECSLRIEPYSFEVKNAQGDTIPVTELSGAEKIMFSLAFQCAVSRTANLGLVVIDEVAMFLTEIRPILNRCLYGMVEKGYLEQVILLSADTSEDAPRLNGAVFFMVKNGTVTRLVSRAAAKVA